MKLIPNLTSQDRDVNVQDGEGLTPLHHAVEGIKASCSKLAVLPFMTLKLAPKLISPMAGG